MVRSTIDVHLINLADELLLVGWGSSEEGVVPAAQDAGIVEVVPP